MLLQTRNERAQVLVLRHTRSSSSAEKPEYQFGMLAFRQEADQFYYSCPYLKGWQRWLRPENSSIQATSLEELKVELSQHVYSSVVIELVELDMRRLDELRLKKPTMDRDSALCGCASGFFTLPALITY